MNWLNWVVFVLALAGSLLIGGPLCLLWRMMANPAPPPVAWREAEWQRADRRRPR